MSKEKEPCPEFPYFGARYPDATCIEGFLWDLDSCDEPHGGLSIGGEDPCPFCNEEAFIKHHADEENTPDDIKAWIQKLREKYKHPHV